MVQAMAKELSWQNVPTPSTSPVRVIITVNREHHVAQARKMARALAREMGFGKVAASCAETAVTELGNNLVCHTTAGGTITLAVVDRSDTMGLEVIVEDQGPGIADVALAMEDDFSTNGGLGGGLPGVERLMDEFEISSTVGVGTRIVARKWQPCR